MSDFLATLDELVDAEITREFIVRLSGASRAQAPLFAQRLALLPEVRRLEIVASMAHYGSEDVHLDFDELFRACLGDESSLVRRQAVEGLWEDERPDLAPPLVAMLQGDPSAEVRAAAATALGRFVFLAECEELNEPLAQQVRQALELCINSEQESPEVRRRAVEAIAFINDDVVRRIIDRAYADEHPHMRVSALFAMGRNADTFWAETVLAELHNEAPAMRLEAAHACGEMSLRRAVPTLIDLIRNDRDEGIRLTAIWALGQIGGQRAQAALDRLAQGNDVAMAEAAEEALEQIAFLEPSFDLMVVDLEDQGLLEEEGPEAEGLEEEGLEEDELDDFRREFHHYVDEDEDDEDVEDDDEDWPDDFLEIG